MKLRDIIRAPVEYDEKAYMCLDSLVTEADYESEHLDLDVRAAAQTFAVLQLCQEIRRALEVLTGE